MKENEGHKERMRPIPAPHLGVEEQRSEIATTSDPSRLRPSSPPLGSQDPRVDRATEISAWQEAAPWAWPTSRNLTPPALSVDHLFQEPNYKYPLSEMPCSSGTSSPIPWLPAPCSSDASLQSVCNLNPLCTPSTNWLPKPVCWSLLACPQDCYCKLIGTAIGR